MKHLIAKALRWYCTASAEAYSQDMNAAYAHHRYHI